MSLRLYENEKPLSERPHATVMRGEFKSRLVAVKRLQYGEIEVFEREIRQLKKLEHPNLLMFKAVIKNRDSAHIDVVMQLAELETLRDALENHAHTIDWVFSIAHQIASGMAYLHENGIVHGNLSPDNILFQDLVHSRALISNYCASVRRYSPPKTPENLLFEAPEKTPSMAADVYALSLTIGSVLAHKHPETRVDLACIKKATMRQKDGSSKETFLHLLYDGLSADPKARPTAAQYEAMFDFHIPERNYKVTNAGDCSDKIFKFLVMVLTGAIIAFFSSDVQTLNHVLMQFVYEPDLNQD